MAGRIPQEFIDDLLSRVDVVDIIDARVPLRKAGRDFQARCPFHEEKSPSFTVSQNKQFYHCFGCGAHGTAISFLMEYEHLDFIEALKELAKHAGIELPQQNQQSYTPNISPDLSEIMQQATHFYTQQLQQHPKKADAVSYLKRRGLSGEIASEFSIGFAPPGWDNLIQELGTTKTRLEQLVTTGMAVEKEEQNKCYDRFRNRIMFPIRNRRGKVIGFGGRVLDDEDKPKYLNSPESPLFHKGNELYGLYEVRQATRTIDKLLIVEGYMDVVALAQHDIRYAVAALGTAITPEHITLLFKTTSDLIFCLDGDRAGRAAAWKALDIALPAINDGRQARFMFLPDGEDPDTLIRKEGKELFEKRIQQADSLSNVLLDTLSKEVDLGSIDGKAQLAEIAKPKLAKISNPIYLNLIIEELALRTRIDSNALKQQLGLSGNTPKHNKQSFARNRNNKPSLVRKSITFLLNQPSLAQQADELSLLSQAQQPGINLLVQLLEFLQQHPNINCGTILQHWQDKPEGQHLVKLAKVQLETPDEGWEKEFIDAISQLKKQAKDQQLHNLLIKEKSTGLDADDKRLLMKLLKRN